MKFTTEYETKKCVTVFITSPQPTPILNQQNPVRMLQTFFFTIHFNIITPFKPRPAEWHSPFHYRTKILCASHISHACYMPRSPHSHNIRYKIIIKIMFMKFCPVSYHFTVPTCKYSPQYPVLKQPHYLFLLTHKHKTDPFPHFSFIQLLGRQYNLNCMVAILPGT
jgi:hypothetical protein